MANSEITAPVRKVGPILHFVFSNHHGSTISRILENVLEKEAKQGKKIVWLGEELMAVKASDREFRESEGWHESDRLDDTENIRIRKLCEKYRLGIKLLETPRKKQYKKINLLNRSVEYDVPKFPYQKDYPQVRNHVLKEFFKHFNFCAARHHEIVRNLRREIREMHENEVGVITIGTFHKGLDAYVSEKLGVETRRTTQIEPYQSIRESLFEKVFIKNRKPTEDEIARIALETLFGHEALGDYYNTDVREKDDVSVSIAMPIINKLSQLNGVVNKLSAKQIILHWDELKTSILEKDNSRTRVEQLENQKKLLEKILYDK